MTCWFQSSGTEEPGGPAQVQKSDVFSSCQPSNCLAFREASSSTKSLPPMHFVKTLLQPKHFFHSDCPCSCLQETPAAWLQESRLQHPHVQSPNVPSAIPASTGWEGSALPTQSVVPCACFAQVGKNVRRREGRAVLSTRNMEGSLFLPRLPWFRFVSFSVSSLSVFSCWQVQQEKSLFLPACLVPLRLLSLFIGHLSQQHHHIHLLAPPAPASPSPPPAAPAPAPPPQVTHKDVLLHACSYYCF